jgi:hypothetical protein
MMQALRPFVPADAGTQALPDPESLRFGKGWIPASAGMSGRGNSFTPSSAGMSGGWGGAEVQRESVP